MTFAPGLEALAWHTADVAESAYAQLARRLIAPPRGTIEIVLTDNVDFSNGAATPFPSNRIFVYAKPPVDDLSLGYYHDWIDLVVTHELTHILHLDATGWLGRALRQVFGRVPSGWPLFPAVFTPQWNIEGLATHEESRLTGFGRVNGSFFEMMLRTAVLERRFEPIDRATGNTPIWPDGTRPYLYGSRFFDYLDRTHGDTADAAVARRTAGALVPPTLWFDRVGQKAIGWSFTTAWQDWRRELERGYAGLADSLAALGLTQAERLTEAGRLALYPRVSPDGRRLAFAADDGRSDVATRVLELETGRQWKLARRNGLGPSSWLPDGSAVLTSQLEFRDPYHIFADLYRVTGAGEARLTRGGRLAEPDLAADGRRVVAVENRGGDVRLVLYEIGSGRVRPLTSFGEAHWSLPRWAPDGNRIAAGRWRDGNYDVVVLDTLGEIVFAPAGDRAIDAAPAWSPDGRYLLFWSDRSGIPNLYGYDLSAGEPPPLLQVTNVLTGAFYPDVSPDARWIYYSGYHADGFHIERIPFDPAAWRPPPPLDARFRPSAPEPLATRAAVSATRGAGSPPRRYSPWATLLPRYWLPV
ncbi:MAG: PD40 domain-containing protein, partial [Gemmatimonadetes bacterium]|nr:PD40 domain-containing protein [Gemmatimonadota bacterium]